jgi:hypothetical protein
VRSSACSDPTAPGKSTSIDIWGFGDVTTMATLSVVVVGAFAALTLWISVRSFSRSAMH